MIPILYERTESSFNDNGLGLLPELYDADVVEKSNGLLELTAIYPVSGHHYEDIVADNIILSKPNTRDDEHAFRIVDVELDITEQNVLITADSITNDLGSNLIQDLTIDKANGQEAMSALQSSLETETGFEFVSDITTISSTKFSMVSPLEAIAGVDGSLLQIWGGEIKRENNKISLLTRRGYDNVTTFRLGKNINGLKYTTSTASVVTRVYPYYERTVDDETNKGKKAILVGKVVDSKNIGKYPFVHIKPVDVSQEITVTDKMTDEQIIAAIDEWAKNWFTKSANTHTDLPSVSIELDLLELSGSNELENKLATLESLGLFDSVTLYIPEYGLDVTAMINELHYDPMNDRVTSLQAGTAKISFTDMQDSTLSTVQSQLSEIKNQTDVALISADGKNKNWYGDEPPVGAKEGDMWYTTELIDGKKEDVIKTFTNGVWTELVTSATGRQIAHDVDTKLVQLNTDMSTANSNLQVAQQDISDLQVKFKANDDTQAQLTKDLAANSTLITKNKADVDVALDTVNNNLSQAQADTATAVKNADDAVSNANKAVEDAGFATDIANEAQADAANAQADAASAKGQAANALDKANTAIANADNAQSDATAAINNAQDALDKYDNLEASVETEITNVNGELASKVNQTTYNTLAGTVDTVNTLAKQNQSTIGTLATSASVDTVSGLVTKAQSLAEQTVNGLTFKADNSVVNTLSGTVKQQGIDLKAAQGELKLKITQNDLTNSLSGYATQTWAQNQITATATELNSTMMTVQTQVQNSAVGTNLIVRSSLISGYLSRDSGGITGGGGDFHSDNYIATNGATVFTFSSPDYVFKGASNHTLAMYDSDKNFIGWQPITSATQTLSNPNAAYIRFSMNFTDEGGVDGNLSDWLAHHRYKLEKGSLATDWCANPADNATVIAVSKISQTVDGLSATFAKKTDLATTASNLKVTADGLNLLTTATGKKGEKVTQVISDVNNIKTTMTGANGYTTRLQTLEGFQQTTTSNITNLQTQQTTLAGQYTSLIESTDNKVRKPWFDDGKIGTWSGSNAVVAGPDSNVHKLTGHSKYLKVFNRDNYEGGVGWFSVTPGEVYYFSGYMGSWGTTYPVNVGLRFTTEDGNNSWIRAAGFPANSKTPMSAIAGSITVPEGVVRARTWVLIEGPGGKDLGYAAISGLRISKSASGSQITQLQNQIDLRTTVAGKVTAALSLSADGGGTVTIRGASLYVTAASHFDTASIQSAAIANLDAAKITSGSISSDRLATTKLNADNITSGSISAARIATTALSATNITSGTLDVGKLTVKNLSANLIASGTIDASKITVKNLSASNIIGGELDAGLVNVKNLSASKLTAGTIDANKINVVNLNASNITSGKLNANLISLRATDSGKSIGMDGNGISGWDANGKLRMKWGIQDLAGDGQSDPSNLLFYTGNGNKSISAGTNVDDLFVLGTESSTVDGLIRFPRSMTIESNDLYLTPRNLTTHPWHIRATQNGSDQPMIYADTPNTGILGNSNYYLKDVFTYNGHIRKLDVGFGAGAPQEGDLSTNGDSKGFVRSLATYNRTYSSGATMTVTAHGVFGRISSASKYKLDISTVNNITEQAHAFLAVEPKQWFDKSETEDMAKELTEGNSGSVDSVNVRPYYGYVAEDLYSAGLDNVVLRDSNTGELEGIQYDRLTIYHHELIRELYQRVNDLEAKIYSMEANK